MKSRRTKNRNKPLRRGAAVVEFAVCLPLVALLVFGTIESASRIFLKQTLAVTAYESARQAIRNTSTTSQALQRGNAILVSRKVKKGQITFSPTNIASATRGSLITVTATAPTLDNSPMLGRFIADRTLTSQVVMVKE